MRKTAKTDKFTTILIQVYFRCEFGQNITIEDHVCINFSCIILDYVPMHIGAHTLIGPNLGIYPVNYAIDAEERTQGGCQGRPVRIGEKFGSAAM